MLIVFTRSTSDANIMMNPPPKGLRAEIVFGLRFVLSKKLNLNSFVKIKKNCVYFQGRCPRFFFLLSFRASKMFELNYYPQPSIMLSHQKDKFVIFSNAF